MTITLESISELLERGFIDAYDDPGQVKASIDAAIRERDRLRGDVSGMTEELLHVPSREEWRALQKRAERAEAELAALKAKIADTPTVRLHAVDLSGKHPGVTITGYFTEPFPVEWLGKRVALVPVEE
ncbi:MAG TPA: hypothetical protein VFN69_04450 [Rudaea sp.]|nr:hypothetical protein [Rudaea sp.]